MADSPHPAFTPPPPATLNPYAAPRAAIAAGDFAGDEAAPASRGQRLRAAIIDYMIFVVPMAAMLMVPSVSKEVVSHESRESRSGRTNWTLCDM